MPGPLVAIRPRPARPAGYARQQADSPDRSSSTYRLADYLDQHGRRDRAALPPAAFWAAGGHACPADQAALAATAQSSDSYQRVGDHVIT